MGWKFFLPDRFIAPVESKIHEIAGSLVERVPDEGGLMGGKAGVACFFAMYDRWNGTSEYESLVHGWIEQALNPPTGHTLDLRFSSGLAGTAWIIHYLYENGMIQYDPTGVFEQLDNYLFEFIISELEAGHYDYLHGALGISFYFLRQPQNETYRQYLSAVVSGLHNLAENVNGSTVKWASHKGIGTQEKVYNLSLSHGMSSIILILAKIYSEGIAMDKSRTLILGALDYIKKQRLNKMEYLSYYPALALESTGEYESSRLAWCYGDLGPGLAFRLGGSTLERYDHLLHGQEVLLSTSRRRDPEENSVFDAGICHGSSGLALIYNILYQNTGLTPFREAALYWLDITLNKAVHKDGIAGYKTGYHPDYGGWQCSAGLLEGAAGIGLSLMSFVHEDEPGWAKSLLII